MYGSKNGSWQEITAGGATAGRMMIPIMAGSMQPSASGGSGVLSNIATSANQLPTIQPWVHWITVWDENATDVLWRGPIQSISANRTTVSMSVRDVSIYGQKTRTPITKKWDAADPAAIAAELWNRMLEDKGINVAPIVRPDPLGDRFDYSATYDSTMLESNISDLEQMGLRWTVVAGVPVLGPLPLKPIAALLALVPDTATTMPVPSCIDVGSAMSILVEKVGRQ